MDVCRIFAVKVGAVKIFWKALFEFDIENLKPTYKLLVGIPGKSNAFAISKKLGLDEQILNVANAHLKEDKVSIEAL